MNTDRLKHYGVLGIAGFCLLLATAANAAKPPKIAVCHVPPGNPENIQIIQVGAKGGALDAHLAHGDYLVSEEMCDAIADNNCDGAPDAAADDADCAAQLGAGATCDAGVCVEQEPVLTCPCWEGLSVSDLALVIDDSAQRSSDDNQHVGLQCVAEYAGPAGELQAGAQLVEASSGDGTITGIGANQSYKVSAVLLCFDFEGDVVSCESPDVFDPATFPLCQLAEYDATTLANNRGRMDLGSAAAASGANCVRELDAAFRARSFEPRCDALLPPPAPQP